MVGSLPHPAVSVGPIPARSPAGNGRHHQGRVKIRAVGVREPSGSGTHGTRRSYRRHCDRLTRWPKNAVAQEPKGCKEDMTVLAGVIAVALLGYLAVALVKPEWF